jgi:hypothetical protein
MDIFTINTITILIATNLTIEGILWAIQNTK